jgi:hypothetical protein
MFVLQDAYSTFFYWLNNGLASRLAINTYHYQTQILPVITKISGVPKGLTGIFEDLHLVRVFFFCSIIYSTMIEYGGRVYEALQRPELSLRSCEKVNCVPNALR